MIHLVQYFLFFVTEKKTYLHELMIISQSNELLALILTLGIHIMFNPEDVHDGRFYSTI